MNVALVTIIVYLLFMLCLAWYFSRKESLEDYFLNKRSTSVWMLTSSHFASMIGAGVVIAFIAEIYNTGISTAVALVIAYLTGCVIMGVLAKRIKSMGDKYKARSMVDFFAKRFDKKNMYLIFVSQLVLLTLWISVQAVAISTLASVLIGIDRMTALIITSIVTIVYTSIGGLKIDIISDFIQAWIMGIVFLAMGVYAYNAVGGFSKMVAALPKDHLNLFAFNGPAWFIGVVLVAGWVFIGNAAHWQRIFAAKDSKTARNAYFYLMPLVVAFSCITIFLGLSSVSLIEVSDHNQAVFVLMETLLPPIMVGLGFSALLAVIMSSIDSLLIAGSTILFRFIFGEVEDNAKEVFYARMLTAVFGFFGFLLAYLIPNIMTLSLITTYYVLLFAPPIVGAVFSKKFSSGASFWSLLIPMIILILFYGTLKNNIFLVTMPVGILIAVFYDKIKK